MQKHVESYTPSRLVKIFSSGRIFGQLDGRIRRPDTARAGGVDTPAAWLPAPLPRPSILPLALFFFPFSLAALQHVPLYHWLTCSRAPSFCLLALWSAADTCGHHAAVGVQLTAARCLHSRTPGLAWEHRKARPRHVLL